MLETVKSMQVLAFVSVYLMARKLLQYFVAFEKNMPKYGLSSWKILVLWRQDLFYGLHHPILYTPVWFCLHENFAIFQTLPRQFCTSKKSCFFGNSQNFRISSHFRKIIFWYRDGFWLKRLITLYLSDQVWFNWFFALIYQCFVS